MKKIPINSDDFLITRPFRDVSKDLFEEWFDAAKVFISAEHMYIEDRDLIGRINDCFRSLQRHPTKFDQHISGSRPPYYSSAQRTVASRGKNAQATQKTRAFLLMERMFQKFQRMKFPLLPDPDVTRTRIRIPSPLLFIRQILTAEDFVASEAYAHTIVRAEIFASAARSFPPNSKKNLYQHISELLTYEAIQESIGRFKSYQEKREATNLRAIDFIVGHYLASLGLAELSLAREASLIAPVRPEVRMLSIGEFLERKRLDFLVASTGNRRDDFGYEIKLTVAADRLPSVSQILNELEGIPLPLPGAKTVFAGGIRLTEKGGAVVRISGRSGSGKTSLALASCVGLAPLGTETFYLSCEEQGEDLVDRMASVTPSFIRSTATYSTPELDDSQGSNWFHFFHLDSDSAKENFSNALAFVDQLMEEFDEQGISEPRFRPPGCVPYVVVLDGVHELIERNFIGIIESATSDGESKSADPAASLHQLIEKYRKLNVLVILVSAGSDAIDLASLDYLVDVVIDLDSGSAEALSHRPLRTANLSKTRRQFSSTGSHKFHISKRDGVRFYPNVESTLEQFKTRDWKQPDGQSSFDFLQGSNGSSKGVGVKIYDRSHTLIAGKGSGGKAAFALRLLSAPLVHQDRHNRTLLGHLSEALPSSRRCLIVSFLYPEAYYTGLIDKLMRAAFSDQSSGLPRPAFDGRVLTFYPGFLPPEVLLSKISESLTSAELMGMPFDCVLVDGLHNVFLQFPLLEGHPLVWPMMSEMFRRVGLTVVTTHSHFEVLGMDHSPILASDVKSVAQRSAPLLQALVNSADYYLDVSSAWDDEEVRQRSDRDNLYKIRVATAFGQVVPRSHVGYWNREAMQIVAIGE